MPLLFTNLLAVVVLLHLVEVAVCDNEEKSASNSQPNLTERSAADTDSSCPPQITFSGYCVSNCTADRGCGPGYKCCSNGCSNTCQKAVASGTAPATGGSTRPVTNDIAPAAITPPTGKTQDFCPGGSVSVPQPFSQPQPLPLRKTASPQSANVLGLTSPFASTGVRDPTQVLSPQRPGAFNNTQSSIARPAPSSPCNYTCFSDSDCANSDNRKCCVQGCQQTCAKPVVLVPPVRSCANIRCAGQCLQLESGAVCDRTVNNGSCPNPDVLYDNSYAPCTSDGMCKSNEKCCRTQSSGFLCTPVSRPLPITCDNIYCPGNQVCTMRNGRPVCVRNKPYQCPYYDVFYGPRNGRQCSDRCTIDIDCPGAQKCCQVGCDKLCLEPDYSGSCRCKNCEQLQGFECREDPEYGYGQCTARRQKVGVCPVQIFRPFSTTTISSFPRPCIGNDVYGECGVDADCPNRQKCCRPDYCQPSVCTDPQSECNDFTVYCNFNETCKVIDRIARCVSGVCPTPSNVAAQCPAVLPANNCRGSCRDDSACRATRTCSDRLCCPDNFGRKCERSGVFCGYISGGTKLICRAGELCLLPFYPVTFDVSCYDPRSTSQQAAEECS